MLGMSESELKEYFEKEYTETLSRRTKTEQPKIETDLIEHGI